MTTTTALGTDLDFASAVGRFEDAVDNLVTLAGSPFADGPTTLDPDRLVEMLQRVETARNRLQAVDTQLISHAETRQVPDRWLTRTVPGALATVLRLSRAEAARRVRLAHDTHTRTSLSGAPIDPPRPALAVAVTAGRVTPQQAGVITRRLGELTKNPNVTTSQVDGAEESLVTLTGILGPEELDKAAIKIADILDPDGTLDDDAQHDQRSLTLGRRGDMYHLRGKLTNEAGAKLWAALEPLTRPRPDDATGRDPRTADQRRHDALEELSSFITNLCNQPGSANQDPATNHATDDPDAGADACPHSECLDPVDGDAPSESQDADADTADTHDTDIAPTAAGVVASRPRGLTGISSWLGGPTATVIVTVAATDLLTGTGHGETSDGTLITIPQLLRLAGQAEIIPAFLNDAGAVLALGRTRRFATPQQTLALIARDGGCSFPGCTMPPPWCDRHHIISWLDGGPTDLDNLTLLCQYHHYRALEQGWECRINTNRLVEWIPPRYIDPHRTPIVSKPWRPPRE